MSNPAEQFGHVLADLISGLSARALRQDPLLHGRLQTLDGASIEICCTAPPLTWHVNIDAGHLSVVAGAAPAPQAVISASAPALLGWLLPNGFPQPDSTVKIDGDAALVSQMAEVLRSFNPDLQQPLSQLVGQDLAATLLGTAEMGLKSIRGLVSSLAESAQYQAGQSFVAENQLEPLLSSIDALRLRVDRLAAGIEEAERKRQLST